MRTQRVQLLGASSAVLLSVALISGTPASATPTGTVPYSQALFRGYATGTELHLGAATVATNQLLSLDQGFSGASTNSTGLTSVIKSETGSLVQPIESATVKAYDLGSGLNVGLGSADSSVSNPLQGLPTASAISLAPPNLPAVLKTPINVSAEPLLSATGILGQAQAVYEGTSCPTGPISYGLGNLASANALTLQSLVPGVAAAPLLTTAGDGTSVAQSKSETFLSKNSDGTFGLSTVASDIIAPITLNVLGLAQVQIAIRSAGGVNNPVTLTANAPGGASGSALKLSDDDILYATITAGGVTTNLPGTPLALNQLVNGTKVIPLSTSELPITVSTLTSTLNNVVTNVSSQLPDPISSTLGSALGSVLNSQPVQNLVSTATNTLVNTIGNEVNLSLGEIDIDTAPHAIGGSPTSAPTLVGGTQAAGALDLLHVNLGLSGSIAGQQLTALPSLLDASVAHLEAASANAKPISCAVPVVAKQIATTTTTAPAPVAPAPTTLPAKLPFTGAMGGPWQPLAGLAVLGLGGGSLALARRLRRGNRP